jgi:heme/copper-type cytochrome/quinol oxidase subunit 2
MHNIASNIIRMVIFFCFSLNNRGEDNNTTRISILIIICVIIIVFLLLVITSYTRSSNEPFNNNSIDYAGEDDLNKINDESNLKIYNINL